MKSINGIDIREILKYMVLYVHTMSQSKHANDKIENVTTAESYELFDREVYTLSGVRLGVVKDVLLDFDTYEVESLLLKEVNQSLVPDLKHSASEGIEFPYRYVRNANDIITVRELHDSHITVLD